MRHYGGINGWKDCPKWAFADAVIACTDNSII
jgi:hypothetical protein